MSTTSGDAPVALVTGANKGIGLETVRRLVNAGFRVYLAARSAERGEPAAASAGAQFVELDVTAEESVRRAAKIVEEADGHLDVLSTMPASPARSARPGTTPATTWRPSC
jgi:NAD(P)-dependent dehydrogenase (short-subunit alcohol dehydrogenase family)